MHPREDRNHRGEKNVARQLRHRRHAQHHVVVIDLLVGQRGADDLRGVVHRGAEKQADRLRRSEQRVREIGIRQHPEQAERDDVGDRVGDFPFVGFDRRRGRDDRRDAADARARGDQRAQSRRQPELAIEPRDEDQSGGDRGKHDRQSRDAELDDIEHAQPDADEHDAGAQDRRGRELEAGIERRRQRQRVAKQQAEHDRHGNARERAAAGQSLRARICWPIRSASQKPASITTNAARTPGSSVASTAYQPESADHQRGSGRRIEQAAIAAW